MPYLPDIGIMMEHSLAGEGYMAFQTDSFVMPRLYPPCYPTLTEEKNKRPSPIPSKKAKLFSALALSTHESSLMELAAYHETQFLPVNR